MKGATRVVSYYYYVVSVVVVQGIVGLLLLSSSSSSSSVFHGGVDGMTVATAPSFQPPNKSSSKPLDRLGISAHLAAAMGATVELREDFEHLHHGHGVLFLIASKIVREVNVLREELEETIDDVPGAKSRVQHVHAAVWTVLTSPTLATVFALAALYAATVEVIQDVVPGGTQLLFYFL